VPQAEEEEKSTEEQKGTGLFCFLNGERGCGPDCMAYAAPPAGADYQEQQWANCKVLVALHQGGKHLIVLAQMASNAAADRKRTQPPPPPPR
jgi:hypothetical protein